MRRCIPLRTASFRHELNFVARSHLLGQFSFHVLLNVPMVSLVHMVVHFMRVPPGHRATWISPGFENTCSGGFVPHATQETCLGQRIFLSRDHITAYDSGNKPTVVPETFYRVNM